MPLTTPFIDFGNRKLDPGRLETGLLETGQNELITKETIRRNQELADLLFKQSQNTQPIRHPVQGLAQLAKAFNVRNLRKRIEKDEQALKAQEAKRIGVMLSNLDLDPQGRQLLESLDPKTRQAAIAQIVGQRFEQPAEPNISSKQLREGDNFVTRRIVNGQPDMSETGILSTSPIDRIQRTEAGGPGAFDPRTRSQQGADVQEFQDAVIGGLGAIQTGSELLQIARETPEALGAPGTILRVGNEFIRTGVALGAMFGEDVDPDRSIDNFTFDGFGGQFRNAAIESQAFRSGVFGIAFAAAVAEQGTRPTDKDIQAFIDQIAGSTADPRGFARTIKQFVGRIDRRLRNTATVKGIPKEVTNRAFGELDTALVQFNTFFPKANEIPGFEDLTEAEQEELKRLLDGS